MRRSALTLGCRLPASPVLAQNTAQSGTCGDVRAYAARLAQDYAAYSPALGQLAQTKGTVLPPETKDTDGTRLAAFNPMTDETLLNEAIRPNAEDKKQR